MGSTVYSKEGLFDFVINRRLGCQLCPEGTLLYFADLLYIIKEKNSETTVGVVTSSALFGVLKSIKNGCAQRTGRMARANPTS